MHGGSVLAVHCFKVTIRTFIAHNGAEKQQCGTACEAGF